jgi:hypothetical protein
VKKEENINEPVWLDALVEDYGKWRGTKAIVLAGSASYDAIDVLSDIDLNIYSQHKYPLIRRMQIASLWGQKTEVGNNFWEDGDEWWDEKHGKYVDMVFRNTSWIEEQMERLLIGHQASVGYSTCLWFNILNAKVLFDRDGWFQGLQQEVNIPYSDELVRAIVMKNMPILGDKISSYSQQIGKAVERADWVSVNHRLAAYMASYFDVLLAINRLPHPGEKRLMSYLNDNAHKLPKDMKIQINQLLKNWSEYGVVEVRERLEMLTKRLGVLVNKELS